VCAARSTAAISAETAPELSRRAGEDAVHGAQQRPQSTTLIYSRGMAVRAPTLPTDAAWLNVERALEPGDLLGRILLLDFWTYA
jgi:hypothetical protein